MDRKQKAKLLYVTAIVIFAFVWLLSVWTMDKVQRLVTQIPAVVILLCVVSMIGRWSNQGQK